MGFIRGATIVGTWLFAAIMEYIAYSNDTYNTIMSGIPQIIIPIAVAAATVALASSKNDDQ